MKSKKFWKLSLYEWSIWLYKIGIAYKRSVEQQYFLIELERNTMALLANINSASNSPTIKGSDFYKLPYDSDVPEDTHVTGEMMLEVLNERFKDKPVK